MDLTVDGYRIQYKEAGSGDVVVILQGWGTQMEVYDSIVQILSGQYRVIRLDLPGFGASEEPHEPWSVEDYAVFFIHFMETLQITHATLLGHSYGGRMIIRLAARPELPFTIDRIVLVDSAGILPHKTFRQKMSIRRYKLLKRILGLTPVYRMFPRLIDEWKSRQGSEDYRNASPVMRQCLVMAVNEDLTDLLPLIRQETLLVWGDRDTATPLSDGKLMEQKIPNAGLAVIEDAGHYSFLDQPVVFRRIMQSYFAIGVHR